MDNKDALESLNLTLSLGPESYKMLSMISELDALVLSDFYIKYCGHVVEESLDFKGNDRDVSMSIEISKALAEYVKKTGLEVAGLQWKNGRLTYLGEPIITESVGWIEAFNIVNMTARLIFKLQGSKGKSWEESLEFELGGVGKYDD